MVEINQLTGMPTMSWALACVYLLVSMDGKIGLEANRGSVMLIDIE
ncbi:hypothetical protein [Candidatus Hodgkinia cicadicola]